MSNLHEECGVFGVYAKEKTTVASTAYYGLFALQHRGQESCGIVVNDDGVFQYHKDDGLVNDVFKPEIMEKLGEGNMAVGHVRYGTTGASDRLNAQPIVINHIKGKMALAHNGNLVNSFELRQELELEGSIFHTTSDTEVISYIITKERLNAPSIEEAVNQAMYRIKGAYSLVVMSASKMIAARDPHGFHPLCYGVTKEGTYVIASETCALDAVSATFVRDVQPGEIVVFDGDEIRTIHEHVGETEKRLCIFEHIYFSRPDSCVDGVSVHHARVTAGACLAMEHPVQADVVIGVPDSGLDAAIGYARQSGIPYGIGFIKNKYIGRTFIAPGQKVREDKVKIKLNVVSETVKGKRVVMVDDSIVRGTTSARIVKLLREAGATEVHVRSSAPPFLFPCYYGTDVDSKNGLIAANHSIEEICQIIGADSLGYLNLDHLGMLMGVPKGEGYCAACFDGNYPTDIPKETNKNRFEGKLSERRDKK
ncbi:MAG TPA: amidophosphoribosyltransferase [Candidatus Anaerotignum merdipullorum]|nr:amidophosphoribosyltransferase [Candidatus Anaerotignum merdipullorum]